MPWFLIFTSLAKIIGVIFLIILPMVSYTVYAERRVSALIQDRVGPNRVGPVRSLPADRRRDEVHAQGGLHARRT